MLNFCLRSCLEPPRAIQCSGFLLLPSRPLILLRPSSPAYFSILTTCRSPPTSRTCWLGGCRGAGSAGGIRGTGTLKWRDRIVGRQERGAGEESSRGQNESQDLVECFVLKVGRERGYVNRTMMAWLAYEGDCGDS